MSKDRRKNLASRGTYIIIGIALVPVLLWLFAAKAVSPLSSVAAFSAALGEVTGNGSCRYGAFCYWPCTISSSFFCRETSLWTYNRLRQTRYCRADWVHTYLTSSSFPYTSLCYDNFRSGLISFL